MVEGLRRHPHTVEIPGSNPGGPTIVKNECFNVNSWKEQKKYIYAFDPIIKRRAVYMVVNDWAISLVTGHKFVKEKNKWQR